MKSSAYALIYNELYLKILNGEYKDGDMLPAELELCKKYFVSRSTMQRALSLLVEKGCLTRIAGKGSFVNRTVKPEAVHSNTYIGLVLCGISSFYGIELVKSVEHFAAKSGQKLLLRFTNNSCELEGSIIKELSGDKNVSGIILQPVHNEKYNPEILNLSLRKYPVVLLDRNLDGVALPFVGTDNSLVTEKVMQYLFEKGHRNIGFVSCDPQTSTSVRDRFYAVNDSFLKQEIFNKYSNHYLKVISTGKNATIGNVAEDLQGIREYIRANAHLTCIFAGEYTSCCLVQRVLGELGIKVPDDISLITFDNIVDPFVMQNTAYVKQNEYEMGKKAVELLSKRIADSTVETNIYISADFLTEGSIKALM